MAARREDYIKKIIALLNLADNNSVEHESEAARNMAANLMKKYAITEQDIESADIIVHMTELEYSTCPTWYREIWHQIGTEMGVYVVYHMTGRGKKAMMCLAGPEEEVMHLEFIGHQLCNQINELSYRYFYDKPEMSRAERMPYRNGLSRRACERMIDMLQDYYKSTTSIFSDNLDEDLVNPFAVVLAGKVEKGRSKYEESQGKAKLVKTTIRTDGQAFLDGLNDGDKLSIRRGVDPAKSGRLLN